MLMISYGGENYIGCRPSLPYSPLVPSFLPVPGGRGVLPFLMPEDSKQFRCRTKTRCQRPFVVTSYPTYPKIGNTFTFASCCLIQEAGFEKAQKNQLRAMICFFLKEARKPNGGQSQSFLWVLASEVGICTHH